MDVKVPTTMDEDVGDVSVCDSKPLNCCNFMS